MKQAQINGGIRQGVCTRPNCGKINSVEILKIALLIYLQNIKIQ